jgi:hypothetical protein
MRTLYKAPVNSILTECNVIPAALTVDGAAAFWACCAWARTIAVQLQTPIAKPANAAAAANAVKRVQEVMG